MLTADTNKKKIAFHTLGCKLNFAETSTISRSFPEDRYERVPASSKADIYIINTCSVTDSADKKCRQAIKKFIHLSPDAFIAVVGCYAQLSPEMISSIPGVDLVLGTNEKFDIPEYIGNLGKKVTPEVHSCEIELTEKFSGSYSYGDRTRSFLKVQDGCDYKCSYCTIPLARGKSRNPDISDVISEAEKIASQGIQEIVLTGVNIGDFGRSTGNSFFELLKELLKVEGIRRYRISSIEPNLLTDDILHLSADNGKILPHFHIPLQSGSDRILGLMRRRYKREVFADRVHKIREVLPLAGIGADVITGFPGETKQDFEDTYEFIRSLSLTYLHVFTFSERPGTVAAALTEKIPHGEKEARHNRLVGLSNEKSVAFHLANEGVETTVLFEKSRTNGMVNGFTPNYIKVEHPWKARLAGSIINVKLKNMPDGRMVAEIKE